MLIYLVMNNKLLLSFHLLSLSIIKLINKKIILNFYFLLKKILFQEIINRKIIIQESYIINLDIFVRNKVFYNNY